MAMLPSETLTILFTAVPVRLWRLDELDSEAVWALEQRIEEVRALDQRLNAILLDAVQRRGGSVFHSPGDWDGGSLGAAFAVATDGVRAALDGQRALAAVDWGGLVGMALHTGSVIRYRSDDGGPRVDYIGPAVNHAARLSYAAHGGQILVSEATRTLVEGPLRGEVTVRDLGSHRLRREPSPEHIFQLDAPGRPAHFPPLEAVETTEAAPPAAPPLATPSRPSPPPLPRTVRIGPNGEECGECRAAVSAAERFCGTCGERLVREHGHRDLP